MITTLRKLFADHAKTAAELDRITTLQANLTAEEKKLLVTTDPEDDQAFRILGAVRLKKDCCPAKIEQLGGKIERLEGEILAEVNHQIPEFTTALLARAEELISKIAKALQPFYDTEATGVGIAKETDAGARALQMPWVFSATDRPFPDVITFAGRFCAAVESAGLAGKKDHALGLAMEAENAQPGRVKNS